MLAAGKDPSDPAAVAAAKAGRVHDGRPHLGGFYLTCNVKSCNHRQFTSASSPVPVHQCQPAPNLHCCVVRYRTAADLGT
ncbi:hypothetical protein CHLRE_11g467532v5 [Chlamydomonas reinhardtii]|uniref:Uncharacterized protein n=1 Tax=Chlamydomonas reinhardtii TaxID=3055 RepID=A0A2K3D771_CHLRE|nr:uncharacterized protein CHLRE_11g467532v5 [Chlamydomonas reinhardtii]XP_042919291.1 uncharacterized protein CHLRE_11g467532v5 [Chlamydomonas reinhardtii]XP_042919292.1 uncharacterized protein CHLRE_11g467532v5 [Chlamydomonas reinhardtii]PNW76374.1 hypothetical protein CHLRE_11g467532v5 [Chlamydomonas reinhardtii]PNW76375.1 hypothetical protein CHLRE_11g467532v5 [Chlamydomonas reinhardtii]PNW76376.1 hypothetical protein CHLRE_11g467532v5 [Chlamydomonas reinhardtii]